MVALRGLRFLKDEHGRYTFGVDAIGHYLNPGHAWLVPTVIEHSPLLIHILVPDEAQVVLPHKTDQARRGISRDRYLFCLSADREDVSDAERAAYRNEKA